MCNCKQLFDCFLLFPHFMRGACRTESDFAVDILNVPLSRLDAVPLFVPRYTPRQALPSASALLVHATVSIIKAGKRGYLPDAPKGQVRPTRHAQHATLVTSLPGTQQTQVLTSQCPNRLLVQNKIVSLRYLIRKTRHLCGGPRSTCLLRSEAGHHNFFTNTSPPLQHGRQEYKFLTWSPETCCSWSWQTTTPE